MTTRSVPLLLSAAVGSTRRSLPQNCKLVLQRPLPRALAAACSSTWALSQRNRNRSADRAARQRRPIVNGEAVAFHVNDLQQDDTAHFMHRSAKYHQGHDNIEASREFESDLVVVLDMDECLIHSQFLTAPGAKYTHQLVNRRNGSSDTPVDSFKLTLPDGDFVSVNKRPFLDDFLEAVTSKYETHIFTAAMEVYAKPLLDVLDPDNTRFVRRWYRDSCDFDPTLGVFVKDLGQIHSNHKRLVLVDNNPLSFLANPENGILVSSFFNNPQDTSLLAVLQLLEELEDAKDVRPILDDRFGLRAALNEIESTGSAGNDSSFGSLW